jgi:predicted glycogen debranching enzyme
MAHASNLSGEWVAVISLDQRTKEWLETNGIGGYASSTILGLNTRRYHGLLVAAIAPPAGRMVLLSKLEESVVLNGRRYDLSTNRYPGVVHPSGYLFLSEFQIDPFPRFAFRVEDVEIEKRVFLVHGENTVVIEYEFRGPGCKFELRPLIAFRDYHATTRRNDALNPAVQNEGGVATLTPYAGLPSLHIAHDATEVRATGDWYFNFEYDIELERGFTDREDLFNPFVAHYDASPDRTVTIIASTERHQVAEARSMRQRELERRAAVVAASPSSDSLTTSLVAAADQFIVKRGELETVIAGYHWFSDWGRDTMIALPGLTITTGRCDIARNILLTFARYVDQGMLPNRFPDHGETPEYNSVDATLWMFEAVRAYAEHTNEWDFVRDNLYGVLTGIIDWHRRGTRFGIRVDTDGLLHAGEAGVQLTWMDAKVGDLVVTPRRGKPVEVQALWYNALRIMESFAERYGDTERQKAFVTMADRACGSFNAAFWNAAEGCLYDVIDDARDNSLRPNQILAVSLPYSMLDFEANHGLNVGARAPALTLGASPRAKAVVATVERELLTPRGLRTLGAKDRRYRGRYTGDPFSRDTAYHQGTVWPWLAGPFFTAYLKVHDWDQDSRTRVKAWLAQFETHLTEAGLGQVSEIFDGDPPFTPRGCIAQAWSVAELLRLATLIQGGKIV